MYIKPIHSQVHIHTSKTFKIKITSYKRHYKFGEKMKENRNQKIFHIAGAVVLMGLVGCGGTNTVSTTSISNNKNGTYKNFITRMDNTPSDITAETIYNKVFNYQKITPEDVKALEKNGSNENGWVVNTSPSGTVIIKIVMSTPSVLITAEEINADETSDVDTKKQSFSYYWNEDNTMLIPEGYKGSSAVQVQNVENPTLEKEPTVENDSISSNSTATNPTINPTLEKEPTVDHNGISSNVVKQMDGDEEQLSSPTTELPVYTKHKDDMNSDDPEYISTEDHRSLDKEQYASPENDYKDNRQYMYEENNISEGDRQHTPSENDINEDVYYTTNYSPDSYSEEYPQHDSVRNSPPSSPYNSTNFKEDVENLTKVMLLAGNRDNPNIGDMPNPLHLAQGLLGALHNNAYPELLKDLQPVFNKNEESDAETDAEKEADVIARLKNIDFTQMEEYQDLTRAFEEAKNKNKEDSNESGETHENSLDDLRKASVILLDGLAKAREMMSREHPVESPNDDSIGNDMPGDLPTGDMPTGDMTGDMPTDMPTGDMTEDMPTGDMTTDMPEDLPEDMPTGDMPEDMPGDMPTGDMTTDMPGDMPTGDMTGDMTTDMPGDMSTGDMTGDMPTGDMTEDMPTGDMTEDMPTGDMTTDMPEDLPEDMPTGDMPTGDMETGDMPGDMTEDMTTGDMTGDMPGDMPTGDMPEDMPGDMPTGDMPTGDMETGDMPGDMTEDMTTGDMTEA